MTETRKSTFAGDGIVAHAAVSPNATLARLSQREVDILCNRSNSALRELFRRCALAVLSSGSETDDVRTLFERYRDFDVELVQAARGLRLNLRCAPAGAFVGGEMINGVRDHLFAVLRDIVYTTHQLESGAVFDLATSAGITDAVFKILRNAGVLDADARRGLAVCWGGHSINRTEYDYTKEVGYALGLRGLDVCTGCGPGAMKGPMKGATIAHAKQRISRGRYIGITEPGIIAAEAPNPIVNTLVIMPDIEKRLEAFVRLAHGIVIFPGGVGTAEEILYLLGLLSHPDNSGHPLPLVLTGPASSVSYFAALDEFIQLVLGSTTTSRYRIIIDDPHGVADFLAPMTREVLHYRELHEDASYFNWRLRIDADYQTPFNASHEAMAKLVISRDLPAHQLASNLRRLFSGIVAGNVKEIGIAAVEANGPFQINGDPIIMRALDALLGRFVAAGRMRLPGGEYHPCYEIVR